MQQTTKNKDTSCHHYTRRDFIKAMGLGTAGIALGTSNSPAGSAAAGTARRPNLLFIFADQLGYQRCGYAGDRKARTPNIDKLASQAVNFQNAVSNMPVCSAYRASLFTGKYTTSTGMVINVPDKYVEMFKDVSLPNPPNYKGTNDKYADNWGRLKPQQRKMLQTWRRLYYAMTANLDWNIGRLLNALEQAGLSDNTIVVFSSDHGEMFGAHGRRAKNIFYEEAARIPFLIRWPKKIRAGTVSDACISTVDFMPTILSLMGLHVPESVEGMDLSHCALGSGGSEPQAALLQNTGACAAWEDGHEWRGLRDKRYTYAVYRVDKSELLFDNTNDQYQMKNLAGNAQYKGTLERFRQILARKMDSLNDTFEKCTWYRDNWTDSNRNIIRAAKG